MFQLVIYMLHPAYMKNEDQTIHFAYDSLLDFHKRLFNNILYLKYEIYK